MFKKTLGYLVLMQMTTGYTKPLFICNKAKQTTKKTTCSIVVEKGASPETMSAVSVLKKDLLLSGYADAEITYNNNPFSVPLCKQLFDADADFIIHAVQKKNKPFLRSLFFKEPTEIEITVAQAHDGKVLFTQNISSDPVDRTYATHKVADRFLKTAFNLANCFDSTLAWCQEDQLIIADPLGIICKPLLSGNGLIFAPTWHQNKPLLFYSQSSKLGHILKSINVVDGKINTCINRKGLSMQLCYNDAETESLMVLSGGKGNSEIFLSQSKNENEEQVVKQLTHNRGTNTSPFFTKDGNIVFCSDFETKTPQLYYLYTDTKKLVRLTDGSAYCASPSYCKDLNIIVYTKPKYGIFQLYMVDLNEFDGKHFLKETQLTSGRGNKTDPSFHPSGLLVSFVYEFINHSGHKEIQIGLLNRLDETIHVVTSGPEKKGYPAWIDRSWWHSK